MVERSSLSVACSSLVIVPVYLMVVVMGWVAAALPLCYLTSCAVSNNATEPQYPNGTLACRVGSRQAGGKNDERSSWGAMQEGRLYNQTRNPGMPSAVEKDIQDALACGVLSYVIKVFATTQQVNFEGHRSQPLLFVS